MKSLQNRKARFLMLLIMVMPGFLLPACQKTDARVKAREALDAELAVRQSRQGESLASYRLAAASYDKGDFKTARDQAQKAIAAYDRNAQAWMLMGLIENEECRIFEAAGCFHKASLLAPDRYEPLYNIGVLLESFGRYMEAIESYQAALKLSPGQLEVIENLARCYIRTGTHLNEAKSLIDQALLTEQRSQWRQWLSQQSHMLSMRKVVNP